MAAKRILFIGHEASVSGAPVLLLNLLQLLREQPGIKVSLVMSRGGPFLETYRQHYPVLVMKPEGYAGSGNMVHRAYHILLNRVKWLYLVWLACRASVIFSNTIVNGRLLKSIRLFRKKMVTYVHELDRVIETYIPTGDSALTIRYSRLFAYPSGAVKEALLRYGIAQKQLHRLSYYFPVAQNILNDTVSRQAFAGRFRQQFDLSAGFIVGGMGKAGTRKGTDMFIEVCEKVVRRNRDIQFCWIGAFDNSETETYLRNLASSKGIEAFIRFTGAMPYHLYNPAALDLFFLSSREDPYPLVVLEAGFMEVPAICFEASGGIPEFVENDAGWVIPGFSVEEAAETILELYRNRALVKEKGKAARKKSLSLHADKEKIIGQFNNLLNSL